MNILGITVAAAALGAVLGLVVATVSGEYCIGVRDFDLCNVDRMSAMIAGGVIAGAAGFLWEWRQ